MAAASSVQSLSVPSLNRGEPSMLRSRSPNERLDDEESASDGLVLRLLPRLEPDERNKRLERTRRELSNRRKILVKNLSADTSSQDVHDLLKNYELKYCYVDRNKGTAFVTLLNGEQAQDAIRTFHQSTFKGKELTVQLQPTDSLLCITNLPHTFTLAQFEELVRTYGNIERCFLVYSEHSGHSKGYGFVEYMKKDSASKARSELLGKQLGEQSLMVQWTDVNQLTPDLLHSKCLCVDRLPADFSDTEELAKIFSRKYKPVFCQLAQDEGSHVGGFAVLEYESAEQAEGVLKDMDSQVIRGNEVRVSFCAPGTSGRSTLAALIAAQGVMSSNKKGLLPEPSVAQMLNSMNNPAALQVLMRSFQASAAAKPSGIVSLPQGVSPFLRGLPLAAALLQLGNAQQNALLGNGLLLQNIVRMQMAQQQLLQLKEKQANTAPSLLGDPSRVLLQKAMGMQGPAPLSMAKGLLGEPPNGLPPEPVQVPSQSHATSAGLMPYMPSRPSLGRTGGPEQNGMSEKQSGAGVSAVGGPLVMNSYLQGVSNPVVGSMLAGVPKAASLVDKTMSGLSSSSHTSLLGEPPKDLKMPSNPYLNMASVLPSLVLQAAPSGTKAQALQPHGGLYGSTVNPTASQTPAAQYAVEGTSDYSHQYGQYSQEALQQWYQHYQAQGYGGNNSSEVPTYSQPSSSASDTFYSQTATSTGYGDYTSYMQAVSQYYSQAGLQPGYQPRVSGSSSSGGGGCGGSSSKDEDLIKAPFSTSGHSGSTRGGQQPTALPSYSGVPVLSSYVSSVAAGQPANSGLDWSHYYYTQTRGQKRDFSQLPPQAATPDEELVGLRPAYVDSYFKKKRL
ncbi:ribonucleoprotein PTB-binding 2 isoform X1 [Erpetoichthys calabaricus]|uniref:ribonucleoprotein PTB-binding 2 isoform X1 n=1 Tax=Erpetoichthys calabaricus TaxID=27687 RepID=UPI002234CA70|nr:ribonucleoprotein PTB-binding 2 isoform X1 [Erpetoichthys calabaricus]